MILSMIPARMGSQRLKQKNLRELDGIPLITHAIRKCIASNVFDEIWVNSEHPAFGEIAVQEGVRFHQRPAELASDTSTSEDFVYEFLKKHPCEYLFQVHSIAPLLTAEQVAGFVKAMTDGNYDVLLSAVNEQIECAFQGRPVNFSFDEKTNSQNLEPVQRLPWSITAWRRSTYLSAVAAGQCATYAGRIGFHPISPLAGHVIKTERDLQIAEALLPLVEGS